MNNRYLFRGKCETTGKWFYGSLSQTQSWDYRKEKALVPCIVHETDRGLLIKEVDPATIGQCTGLKDKNGKLIFEGDIVCDCDCEFTVGWDDRDGWVTARDEDEYEFLSDMLDDYSVIIGNIHDTPKEEE